jgi:ABC-type polysaccharide/polyol phosphate export permease
MLANMSCFYALLQRELYLFRKKFWSQWIDLSCILAVSLIVFGYVLTSMGMAHSYGVMIFIGAISSFGLFEITWRATVLAQDITDKTITNFLVLPTSCSSYFLSIAVSWGLCSSIVSLCLFPVGLFLLWNFIDLFHICIWRFFLIFLSGNFFYGCFAIWVASLVTSLRNTTWLWSRVINPIFMFGGYFYNWEDVYHFSYILGYLHLINPLIYILEGTKASLLGPSQYLPFWICTVMVWIFATSLLGDGIRRLKKRLDCI